MPPLRRQIGQLLIAGFNGATVPIELKSLAREFGLGGVILFARNIVDPAQTRRVWESFRGEGIRLGTLYFHAGAGSHPSTHRRM